MLRFQRTLIVLSALWGLSAVGMGAYVRHGLSLDPDQSAALETALLYNLVFAGLAFVIAILSNTYNRLFAISGWLFLCGSVLFSASLYFKYIWGIDAFSFLAPWGGLIIMLGWCSGAASALVRFQVDKNE